MLVLFEGGTQSGCGAASSQTGPFYCPLDQKVYIDLDFFQELTTGSGPRATSRRPTCSPTRSGTTSRRTGIEGEVRQAAAGPVRQNELSVRTELQADCLAGVWAQSVYQEGDLERGDLEEGLGARPRRRRRPDPGEPGVGVNPETWTHGSAEQRSKWFNTGFDSGDPAACDTFAADARRLPGPAERHIR